MATKSTTTTNWVILGSKIRGGYINTKDPMSPCLIFDSVQSVETEWPLEVTAYPVETGDYVSDHVQEKNEQYTLTGWVTNSPFVKYGANMIGYDSLGSNDVIHFVARTYQAVQILRDIKEAKQPVTFVNEFEVLTDVILKNVSFSMTSVTADCLAFKLSLEKVRFATAQTTNANISTATNKKIATPKAAGSNTKEQVATSSGKGHNVANFKAAWGTTNTTTSADGLTVK